MALSLVTMRDFHGPFLKIPVSLHSDVHTRAAWTCMPTQAGRGMHSCNKVRAKPKVKTMRAVDAVRVVSNLELTCQLLWASFQFTPRKWKSSVLLRNCSARTWTHAPFKRWIGETKQSHFRLREQSDPKLGITFSAGQNKTLVYNGGTTSNLTSHLQQKHTSKVVGLTVVTQEPQAGLQLPPAAPAAAPISPSLCVLLSECCLPARQC